MRGFEKLSYVLPSCLRRNLIVTWVRSLREAVATIDDDEPRRLPFFDQCFHNLLQLHSILPWAIPARASRTQLVITVKSAKMRTLLKAA
jgi:hypothetical protein